MGFDLSDKFIVIADVFLRVVVLAGQNQQDGIGRKIVHILPDHGRQINARVGAVQGEHRLVAQPVVHPDFALAGHVDEDKFRAPVGMLAPHHVPVGAIHIKDALDHKGNVLLALHHHQMAPLVAVLSDRVPSGIRGTMSAFYGAGSTIGTPIGTMIGAFFIENLTAGFAVAGVLMFLGGIVAVIILPKEQSADFLPKEEGSFKDVLVSFRPPKFAGAHDFYKAFAGRFCMLMSYQMINVYQLYIIQNYIGQSVKESAVTVSVVAMLMMVMSLVGSFISGPVSDLIGRRKAPVVVASVLFAIGIAMPWLIPSTLGMYLFAGIAGLGYAVYSAVDQALLVDVLPNKEEAGKDLGILNMGTTLGQMCGPVIMSTIVVSLGYNFAFPTAIALAIIGCFFIMAIKKVK